MRCPQCEARDTRVVDSRDLDDAATVRRRRECAACGTRFTTYERIEAARLVVVKRDGSRQEFDRAKLTAGLRKALTRRPVPDDAAERAADAIEAELRSAGRRRGPELADRRAGPGAAPRDRPDRLHPVRLGLPELRGPRGAQARGRQPVSPSEALAGSASDPRPGPVPERAVMSVLSDRDIRAELEAGRVVIRPYDPADLQPSSVDLHLDRSFRVFRNNRYPYIDVRQLQPDLTELLTIADDEPFILHPGEFVLGQTLEWVELPDDLVARLEGKSSLGRLGLLIHSTAGYVDPGWKGTLTLELSNVANLPIALYPGMRIGQISFFRMSSAGRAAVRQPRARLEVPGPVGADRVGVPPGLRGRAPPVTSRRR